MLQKTASWRLLTGLYWFEYDPEQKTRLELGSEVWPWKIGFRKRSVVESTSRSDRLTQICVPLRNFRHSYGPAKDRCFYQPQNELTNNQDSLIKFDLNLHRNVKVAHQDTLIPNPYLGMSQKRETNTYMIIFTRILNYSKTQCMLTGSNNQFRN